MPWFADASVSSLPPTHQHQGHPISESINYGLSPEGNSCHFLPPMTFPPAGPFPHNLSLQVSSPECGKECARPYGAGSLERKFVKRTDTGPLRSTLSQTGARPALGDGDSPPRLSQLALLCGSPCRGMCVNNGGPGGAGMMGLCLWGTPLLILFCPLQCLCRGEPP